jgi:hypothetical protein
LEREYYAELSLGKRESHEAATLRSSLAHLLRFDKMGHLSPLRGSVFLNSKTHVLTSWAILYRCSAADGGRMAARTGQRAKSEAQSEGPGELAIYDLRFTIWDCGI